MNINDIPLQRLKEILASDIPLTIVATEALIARLENQTSVVKTLAERNIELTKRKNELNQKLEKAEAAVARVRVVATGDPTEYGWSEAMLAVLRALDGEQS